MLNGVGLGGQGGGGRIINIKDSLKATWEPTTIEVFQIHTHIHTQKEFKYLIVRTNTLTTYITGYQIKAPKGKGCLLVSCWP